MGRNRKEGVFSFLLLCLLLLSISRDLWREWDPLFYQFYIVSCLWLMRGYADTILKSLYFFWVSEMSGRASWKLSWVHADGLLKDREASFVELANLDAGMVALLNQDFILCSFNWPYIILSFMLHLILIYMYSC